MGGRAAVSRLRGAGRILLFAATAAGFAFAAPSLARAQLTVAAIEAPTANEAPSAPNLSGLPAGTDEGAFTEPASSGEEQPSSPAAAPAGEENRAPVDVPDAVATPPAGDHGETESKPAAGAVEPTPDPIVAAIRLKLQDPALRKGAAADDLAALEAFYGEHRGQPLWITTVGFSVRGQALIAEIQKADEWGLPRQAFDLPPASDLPATTDTQAVDEVKLALAILKYARYAKGGRISSARISALFDQKPNVLDPKHVFREVAVSDAPAAYLASLHPKHDQFEGLRRELLKARAGAQASKPNGRSLVQRLIVNMERWRWMPPELGSYYVWNNVPAFTTRVMKNGKSIYVEKAIVGQTKYATPIFSAEMRSIVFNPEWTVPETIKNEDLQPRLRQLVRGVPDVSVLRENKLSVSYQGRPVDATTVDWNRVNIHAYTFTQPPGPGNVLGTLKFNFPNRHAIYMHDTVQPQLFKEAVRTLSHGCIRVHKPERLAELLLAEDRGWSSGQVKNMLAKGNNSGVVLNRPVPVHLTYFTMAFDGIGRLQTYADVYGLDAKMAQALFGKSELLTSDNGSPVKRQRRSASNGRVRGASFLPGLFGN